MSTLKRWLIPLGVGFLLGAVLMWGALPQSRERVTWYLEWPWCRESEYTLISGGPRLVYRLDKETGQVWAIRGLLAEPIANLPVEGR